MLSASSGGGIRYLMGSIVESSDPSDRPTVGEPAYRSVDAPRHLEVGRGVTARGHV